jgi:hypothetical protein
MLTNTLEMRMIKTSKQKIKELTQSISSEVLNIRKTSEPDYIENFDNLVGGDWKHYENMLFDEEKFKQLIISATGYFDYGELSSEVDEYVRVYVWLNAWIKHIDGDL